MDEEVVRLEAVGIGVLIRGECERRMSGIKEQPCRDERLDESKGDPQTGERKDEPLLGDFHLALNADRLEDSTLIPGLKMLLIAAVFSSYLVPSAVVLFVFSTPALRRRLHFILKLCAIALSLTKCVMFIYVTVSKRPLSLSQHRAQLLRMTDYGVST